MINRKRLNTAEFYKLRTLLERYNIPFEEGEMLRGTFAHGLQIIYPSVEDRKSDVVISRFSYGGDEGLLEQMGLIEEDSEVVKGWLTAEDVFKCWAEDYGFFIQGLDKEAFNMTTAKLGRDNWIRCGKCGHKLGIVTGSGSGTSSKIEIKCHSCKELNLFSFLDTGEDNSPLELSE